MATDTMIESAPEVTDTTRPTTKGATRARQGVTTSILGALPKVELHCHIEGTMRAGTAVELAAANGIALPADDLRSLFEYDDLTGFLEVFWLVQSTLRTSDDWERLAFESIFDAAPHGLRYREAFFTPARHLESGQHLADIIAGLDRGLGVAERVTGVRCRLILDFDRDFGPDVAARHAKELVRLRRRRNAPGAERVIGVGMDSTELGIDPRTFLPAYQIAAAGGLRRTAHQGENSPASAIAAAVDVLGCQRIDHGISVFEDPQLVQRLTDAQLAFTVCPNANVRINPGVVGELGEHVFPAMREAGLLATLNTDDPALVGLDLTEEYESCAETFGYDFDDMVDIAVDAVSASWLDDGDAAVLVAEIRAFANAAVASTARASAAAPPSATAPPSR